MNGADLSTAQLPGADLSGAESNRPDQLQPVECRFDRGQPDWSFLLSANLSGAKLIGADLIGANQAHVDLSKTVLTGVEGLAFNET